MNEPKDNVLPLVQKESDFETAIRATGFGKYNVLLALITFPSAIAVTFELLSISYVFPVAECDLSLSLSDKGLLNAISFTGMIIGGFIWGYFCNTLGRKKVMVIGYILNGMFVILSSLAQSISLLVFAKFMTGFIICGPDLVLIPFLSEFHSSKHRALVQMFIGFTYSLGAILTPLVAWAMLPLEVNLKLFNGAVELHSWNLYLLVTGIVPIISGTLISFLPETPKFLMTAGKNEEALKVFQMMYEMNTGEPADTFPIRVLAKENPEKIELKSGLNEEKSSLIRNLQQFLPLFHRPYVLRIILVAAIQFLFIMSVYTLRLWLPQLFQAINDYQFLNNGSTLNMCTVLNIIKPKKLNTTIEAETCIVNKDNSSVYINTMVISLVLMVGYVLTAVLINKLGKKKLLVYMGTGGSLSAFLIYFAKNTLTTTILSSLHSALGTICVVIVVSVAIELFPTTLRVVALSITLTTGRIGVMAGNLIFPFLLQAGCLTPFFFVAGIMMGGAMLSLIIPKTDSKALQ